MKKILSVVILFLATIFISGCTRNDKNVIQFTTWGSKTEMEIITPIVEQYNNNHEIKVKIIHIPQNYFHKIHLLFASNLAPDVIFINNLYLKTYQKADLLEDLTQYINKNDYFKNALSTLSVDNKIYAIPRDVSSFVVFYNKNILKKANINIPQNITIDEFYNISKELKKHVNYGFCTELEANSWENFVSSLNKPVIYNNKITINEPNAKRAIQTLSDKINKENIGVNKEQLSLTPCAQLFLNQKTPFFISGRWSIPKIETQSDFEYGIIPFPDGGSKYYIPLNASGWAISKKSKHKEAAINFVKYISSKENIEKIAASGLITPARKDVAKSKFFKNGEVFINTIEKSTPNIVPGDYNVTIDKLNNIVKSVLEGYKTVEEVLN